MLLTIIVFILVLGILVLAHELGHFLTARMFKVKTEEFGFGYPPRIFGWVKKDDGKWKLVGPKEKANKYKNMVWSLNWLPLGGFVQIKGENENDLIENDSFASRKIWQRIIMIISGVVMNVILAIIILSIGFATGIPSILDNQTLSEAQSVKDKKVQIVAVEPDSPAKQSELKIGDAILSINAIETLSVEDVQENIKDKNNETINLQIKRGNEILEIQTTPVLDSTGERAIVGINLVETGIVKYSWYSSIWHGLKATWQLLIAMFVALWGLLKNLVAHGNVPADIAGPVGIAVITGQVARMGFVYILQFTALLSLNLAIINIFPFPALDGGRIIFLLYEAIRRKPANAKFEAVVNNVGFMLLMLLIVLITYKDLTRWGGGIIDKIF